MKKTTLGILMFILLATSSLYSQTAAFKVSGKVTNEKTGEPVAKASVSFQLAGKVTIMIYREPAITGPDGTYSIELPEAAYNVIVKHPSYSAYLQNEVKVASDLQMDFKLAPVKAPADPLPTVTVKGVKIFAYKADAAGVKTGVAGAAVNLYGNLPSMAYKGVTGSNGELVLAEAVAGLYKVVCTEGTNTAYAAADIKTDGQVIEVQFKDPTPPPSKVRAAVKGKVYFSTGSAPIAGARVYAIPVKPADPSGKVGTYGAGTGADGSYIFNIAPGEYYIACTYSSKIPTFAPIMEYYNDAKTLDNAVKLTIADGAVIEGIDFGLDAPVPPPPPVLAEVKISGTLADEAGKPVTGAKLAVYNRATGKQTGAAVTAGADGKYTAVVSLEKGQYELTVGVFSGTHQVQFYNGKSSLYEADILKVDLTGGPAELTNINFVLKAYVRTGSCTIAGTVTDTDKKPLAGAVVEAFNAKGKAVMAQTDAAGAYTISGLPEGNYIVGFSAKGYMPQYYKGALKWENATPVAAGNVTGIDAELKKAEAPVKDPAKIGTTGGGKVKGRIASGDKTPLGGARVLLTCADGTVAAADVTDSEGAFVFEGIAEGSYKLSAGKVNYKSIESELNIVSGTNAENTYYLSMNSATGVETAVNGIPSVYALENNYPNPFNPSTRIRFSLPEAAKVRLEVYSLTGQKVATLIDENMNAGVHEASFNASGLSSGIYFYRIATENFTSIKAMQLLK